MLDSFQIAAGLVARGFSRTPGKENRTKAHGFQKASLKHPIYVRMAGKTGAIEAATGDPLALHPDDADRVRVAGGIPGIVLRDLTRSSSAYLGFPRRVPGGKVPSFDGVQTSVADEVALDSLLALLSSGSIKSAPPVPFPAAAPTSEPALEIPVHPQVVPVELEPAMPDSPSARVAAEEVDSDPKCRDVPSTTRLALINARMGQGGYRRRMLKIWDGRCAVTGCAQEAVLIASHARSWAAASNEERLDEFNGLLLQASLDRLFDKGLISFDNDGRMLCKPELTDGDLACLGLSRDSALRFVRKEHIAYLATHRAEHRF